MLENSYDALGYQFGIVAVSEEEIQKEMSENAKNLTMDWVEFVNKLIHRKILSIVDFKYVDGLTLKEYRSFNRFNDDILLFVMYDKIFKFNAPMESESGPVAQEHCIRKILPVYLSLFYTENTSIDNIIASELLGAIENQDEQGKKRAKCFLQRYKYGTKERTDEVLEYRKNIITNRK